MERCARRCEMGTPQMHVWLCACATKGMHATGYPSSQVGVAALRRMRSARPLAPSGILASKRCSVTALCLAGGKERTVAAAGVRAQAAVWMLGV